MSSPVDCTDLDDTLLRSRKIRIFLTADARAKARKYFGLARYWFNQTVEYLKQPGTVCFSNPGTMYKQLMYWKDYPPYAMDCPQRVRLHAVADAVIAVKAAKMKCKAGNGYQDVSFRSRKDIKQGFGFDAISLSSGCIFGKKAHRLSFYGYEPVPQPDAEGTRLICESGRFFLIVPVKVSRRQVREPRQSCVALDPGVRTFLTYYSECVHGEIGEQAFQRIARLCYALDKLMSKMSKVKAKVRYRMKKAVARMRWKIKDLIHELHWKSAVFLVTRFDNVLMPTFETKQMTLKTTRKLRTKTARSMLTFSFYRFKQILLAAAERYGATIHFVNEAYTSKTCSYCGNIQEIGGRKRFKCKNCQVDIDRDYNGARGIFLSCVAGSGLQRGGLAGALL